MCLEYIKLKHMSIQGFAVMDYLTENQVIVLKLLAKGIKPSEISKSEGIACSSVYEAKKRGRRRIDYATQLLKFVFSNECLNKKERLEIINALSKA